MVPACPAAWHARPSSSSSEVNPGPGSPGGPAGPVGPVDPTGPGSPWMLQTSGRSLRRQASSGAETRRRPSFSRAHAVIVVVSSPARAAMIVPPANTSAVGTSRASHESRIAPPVRVSSPNVYARGGRPASVRAGFGTLSARLRDCELLLAPGAEIHRHERDGLAAVSSALGRAAATPAGTRTPRAARIVTAIRRTKLGIRGATESWD